MIKSGRTPCVRAVAKSAVCREASRYVIGARGSIEIRLMTGVAPSWRRGVVVVCMALHASECGVRTGQGIVREKCVVELCIEPIDRRVAGGAIVRQAKLHMRGIVGVCEIRCVTRVAGRRRPFEYVVDMACRARQRGVRSGQCVAGDLQVVKFGVEPRVHGVAGLAGCRESRRDVIEHWCQKVLLMARVASRR